MILEGVVIAPRWSAAFGSFVGVVVQLLVLELFSQAEAVLHLVPSILVERARAIEDLLVLLIIVALGTRLTDGEMMWSSWQQQFWPDLGPSVRSLPLSRW